MTHATLTLTGWQRLVREAPPALEAWWSGATPSWRWYAAGLTLVALGLVLA